MENLNNNSAPQIPNAAAQILARNRQVAQKYGPYFGKQLFTIIAVNPDPKYKEDVMNGINTSAMRSKLILLKLLIS